MERTAKGRPKTSPKLTVVNARNRKRVYAFQACQQSEHDRTPGSVLSVAVSADHDHIRGPIDAPVTLAEHGDYEWPLLRRYARNRYRGRSESGWRFQLYFRHFPATNSPLKPPNRKDH